ncbi:HalOD1 output domain-containing protein [Halopelagius inordinatus]|nr:HalOD1 output domain-containing protein [Halopelagius inordinatus]
MGEDTDRETISRELDTDAESPGVEVAVAVAGIEGRDAADLPAIHGCIDNVLADLFSNPPSPEARMRVEFTYEGYRIAVEQNGTATFSETT